MAIDVFSDLIARLDALFDDPETRQMPLAVRTPITESLEKMLYEVISLVKPDLFMEVGAFEAGFSVDMKAAYPDASVIALEANPRVYSHFCGALEKNGVNYVNLAADAAPGTVTFFVPKVIAGTEMPHVGRMGSLHEVGLRDSESVEMSVQATTLDVLSAAYETERTCLWIDVEGAVDRVLQGATETLRNTALVYCEIESSPVWKEQALADLVVSTLTDLGFVPIARDCQKWFQYNMLFVRPDHAKRPELAALAQSYTDQAAALFSQGTVS